MEEIWLPPPLFEKPIWDESGIRTANDDVHKNSALERLHFLPWKLLHLLVFDMSYLIVVTVCVVTNLM